LIDCEPLEDESVKEDAADPTPVSETVCDELAALSVTVSVAAKFPVDAGVKVTEMLQLDPAARELPQALV